MKQADDKSASLDAMRGLRSRPGLSRWQQDQISTEIDNILKGAQGERDAAHFLNVMYEASNSWVVIHDLRLAVGSQTVQIDHLLINRYGFFRVLETKNLGAKLKCDSAGQWEAFYPGGSISIGSPIEQARRHVELLRQWLKVNSIRVRGITSAVLLAPTCRFIDHRSKIDLDVPVIPSDLFRRWNDSRDFPILSALAQVPYAVFCIATAWSTSELRENAQRLVDAHLPSKPNYLAQFALEQQGSVARPPPIPIARSKNTIVAERIDTLHGPIMLKTVSDGRIALRHSANPALATLVRETVGATAHWQPKFQNWLVQPDQIENVIARLRA